MLKDYKNRCENIVKGWIKARTDKDFAVTLEDYKEEIASFEVDITHTYGIEVRYKTYSGAITGQIDGTIFRHESKYNQATQQTMQQISENTAIFKDFAEKIASVDYAIYGKKDIVLQCAHSDIFFEYYCGNCDGHGEFKCAECRDGEIKCDDCNGKGENKCSNCRGKGYVKCDNCRNGEVKCSAYNCVGGRIRKTRRENGRDRVYYEKCSRCGGYGVLRCNRCDGEGELKCRECGTKGIIICSKCSGSGFLTCRNCRGRAIVGCDKCRATGILTDQALVCAITTPTYKAIYPNDINAKIKSQIQRFGLPNLDKTKFNIAKDSTQDFSDKQVVIEKHKIEIPFCSFNIIANEQKFAWFIYGKDFCVLEGQSDDMIPAILANDIKILEQVSAKLVKVAIDTSIFNRNVLQHSKAVIDEFMSYEANGIIIDMDKEADLNKNYKERAGLILDKAKSADKELKDIEKEIQKCKKEVVEQETEIAELKEIGYDDELLEMELDLLRDRQDYLKRAEQRWTDNHTKLKEQMKIKLLPQECIGKSLMALERIIKIFCFNANLVLLPLLLILSAIVFVVSLRIENWVLCCASVVVYVIGVKILQKYKEWRLKKYFGARLCDLAIKREITKGIYKYFVTNLFKGL